MRSFVLIALLLAACQSSGPSAESEIKSVDVGLELSEVAFGINVGVQAAAAKISSATEDRRIRRLMLMWQIRIHEYTQRALAEPDPRWAFIDLWTLAVQMLHMFENHQLLGEHQQVAIDASRTIITAIEQRIRRAVTEEKLTQIRTNVVDFAEKNPIVPGTMRLGNTPIQAHESGTTDFATIVTMPTKIFSIGGGVKDTAVSLSEVAAATDRIADAVKDIPQTIRWQVQLMMMDIDQSPTIAAMIDSSAKVAASAESLSRTAEQLPSRVQAELDKTLSRINEDQKELQKTLVAAQVVTGDARATVTEAHAAIKDLDGVLDGAKSTIQEVHAASEAVAKAGAAWEPTFRELRRLVAPGSFDEPAKGAPETKPEPKTDPKPENDDPGPGPFDIKDVGNSADSLTATATELRNLVKEVRGLIQAGEATTVVTDAESAAADLVDTVTWRAIVLMLVFFGLLIGYRLLRPAAA